MNSPVTPFVLAGRILAILGMGFTAAVSILFFVGAFWWWAIGAAIAFIPFFALIVIVEKYQSAKGMIGPATEDGS
jgi:hypothetical protein